MNRSRARGSERPVLETTGEATRIVPRRAHGRAGEVGRWRLDPRQSRDPVLALILERAAAGSVPGARSDPHVVCLAIEGGGMRGSVSAGMCVVLEAAGLVGSFDRIYGCSAGALNGAFTASGQATLGATTYMDSADRRFIDLRRLIRGRPVVDLDLLFDELLAVGRPFSAAGLARGPEFRALAVSPRRRRIARAARLSGHRRAARGRASKLLGADDQR